MDMYAYAHRCWKSVSGVVLPEPSTLFCETELLGLELPELARLADQRTLGICLLLPPQSKEYRC